MVVTDFLVEHVPKIMDFSFTAKVEESFDEIADGKIAWNKMIDDFYMLFHEKVEDALQNSQRATAERRLGVDPKTGREVIVRIGRFGPLAQLGEGDQKPQYANLQKGQLIETITLEEALKLFDLPRTLGDYEGKTVVVAVGRFGPYVRHDAKFASLQRNVDDPMTITLERAIELIEEKRRTEREKVIKIFVENEELQVLNGRYGPYITCAGVNYKLSKSIEPSALTYEQCVEIMSKQEGSTPRKSRFAKKTTDKQPVAPKAEAAKKTAAAKSTTTKKAAATKKTAPKKKVS
jgi:DNA topoisomerase-1